MPGPEPPHFRSTAALIAGRLIVPTIAITSRVMPTQVPQPRLWVSSTTHPAWRTSLT